MLARNTRAIVAALTVLPWLTNAVSAQAVNIFVDAKLTTNGPGGSWATAWNNIQDGIDDASNELTHVDLFVAKGTYWGDDEYAISGACGGGTDDSRRTIVLKSPNGPRQIRLHGGFDGCSDSSCTSWGSEDPDLPEGPFNQTILTGSPPPIAAPYHILVADEFDFVSGSKAILDGFKVTGGTATVTGNCAQDWGAGLFLNGTVWVLAENVTFKDNVAGAAGGAVAAWNFLHDGGHFPLFDCKLSKFIGNGAARGGAIYTGAQTRLCNVEFSENGSFEVGQPYTLEGGAVYHEPITYGAFPNLHSTTLMAANVLMHDNIAEDGAAVCIKPPPDEFTGNSVWRNCTISYNIGGAAPNSGAAFQIGPGSGSGSPKFSAVISNSIIWGNPATSDLRRLFLPNAVNLFLWANDIGVLLPGGTYTGTGSNISMDPLYKNVGARNLRLSMMPVSPCIDTGLDTYVPNDFLDIDGDGDDTPTLPWDLDANPRLVDFAPGSQMIDMGAFETAPPAPGQ